MSALVTTPLAEAQACHAAGHLLAAADLYRLALEQDPENTRALLGLGLIARSSGQLLPALRLAQSAVASAPASPLAHTALAHAWQSVHELAHAEIHFCEALRLNPNELPALLGMAHLATAIGRLPAATLLYQRALALRPRLGEAHAGLGTLFAIEGNRSSALAAFQCALACDEAGNQTGKQTGSQTGTLAQRHFAIAFLHASLGDQAQAIHHYSQTVTLEPRLAPAWLNLGVALVADGRDQLGEHCYHQALAADPKLVSAHLNLGNLARARRRFPEAAQHYASALELAPCDCSLHVARVYLHMEQQQYPEAWRALEQAEACAAADGLSKLSCSSSSPASASATPDYFAHVLPLIASGLGTGPTSGPGGLGSLNNHDALCPLPIAPTGQALTANSGTAPFLSPVGGRAHPNPEIANARGVLRMTESAQRHDPAALEDAIAAFAEAEALGHRTAPSNRGNALLRLGRLDEALAAHEHAVALDPTHPGARYNLALTQLRAGNFRDGWANYEARWRFRDVHARPRRFPQPRWQGQPVTPGQAIFVHAEQGLGDTLQFARYLPLVAARGARLIVEVQPPLLRLIRPMVTALGGLTLAHGEPLPAPQPAPLPGFDWHCPLMSLPFVFATTLETVPAEIPYLATPTLAGPEVATPDFSWPALTESLPARPAIGIAWAGNPAYRADGERSTTLATLLPIVRGFPTATWVSLQKTDAREQIATANAALAAEAHILDACSTHTDLADTARILSRLDLVITTDTAIAHLAGAMGKPLWLLLPWQSDWRWMQQRTDSPWYPQARLFRQPAPGDWAALTRAVVEALQQTFARNIAQNIAQNFALGLDPANKAYRFTTT